MVTTRAARRLIPRFSWLLVVALVLPACSAATAPASSAPQPEIYPIEPVRLSVQYSGLEDNGRGDGSRCRLRVDPEVVERRRELAAGARDERLGRRAHGERRVGRHGGPGLVDPVPLDLDDAREHRPTGLLTALEEAAVDQELIQSRSRPRRHERSLACIPGRVGRGGERGRRGLAQASERERRASSPSLPAEPRWAKKLRRRK